MSEQDWKERAEKLWDILDNIDTSSDVIKPSDLESYKAFYEATMRRVAGRHEILESDGYHLHVPASKVPMQELPGQWLSWCMKAVDLDKMEEHIQGCAPCKETMKRLVRKVKLYR